MEADLFCIKCNEDVPHQVVYINDKISHVECEVCQRSTDMPINPKREFYKEVYKRISSKPSRITDEYRKDLSHFLISLPKRVISKPYRLMKDINESRKIIFGYDKKDKKID
jgi:NAD-dependent SIR2 family protein deacetylase